MQANRWSSCLFLLSLAVVGMCPCGLPGQELVVNEILAHTTDNRDSDDDPDPVIEIYNAGEEALWLGDYHLTDDPTCPFKWNFPSTARLSPGGLYIVLADGPDYPQDLMAHANFTLARRGEVIQIVHRDGRIVDELRYPCQVLNTSYGRFPNGAGDLVYMQRSIGLINKPGIDPVPWVRMVSWHADREVVQGEEGLLWKPQAGEGVVVTAEFCDNDPESVEVSVVVNVGSEEETYPMHDDGAGPDGVAGDGLFTGVISGHPTGTRVDFRVRATDGIGQVSSDPAVPVFYRVDWQGPGGLVVNEILAQNLCPMSGCAAGQTDEHGDPDDWVEIYNGGVTAITRFQDYYLTDDPVELLKWRIATGRPISLPAEGFIRFWCDGQPDQGLTHTNFRLNADGEQILLVQPENGVVDSVKFPRLHANVSYGRLPDGSQEFHLFKPPTPEETNAGVYGPPNLHFIDFRPARPGEGEPVVVRALVDEPLDPERTIESVTILQYFPEDDEFPMTDDGQGSDETAGDGVFTGVIPGYPAETWVEFELRARNVKGEEDIEPDTYRLSYVAGHQPSIPVVINEFLALNVSIDTDEEGDYDDWVELYNPSDDTIDLGGYYLSDEYDRPNLWRIPDGTKIGPKGYLRIWGDDQPRDSLPSCEARLHMTFRLGGTDGEGIFLFERDGGHRAWIDGIIFGPQVPDVSWGRCPDGSASLGCLESPTPGAENGSCVPCDTEPPQVTDAKPGPGAAGVDPGTAIEFKIVDAGTGVSVASITLAVGGVPVDRELMAVGKILGTRSDYLVQYVPAEPFQEGAEVAVRVEAQDRTEPPNQAEETWSFRIRNGEALFRRGDVFPDGKLGLPDALTILQFVFVTGPARPELTCVDAADADDSGNVALLDALLILQFVFGSGDPPMPPRDCGPDPRGDSLPECVYPDCEG